MKRRADVANDYDEGVVTLEPIDRKRERRRLIGMQIEDFVEELRLSEVQRRKLETLAGHVKCAIFATVKNAETPHKMCDLQKFHASNIHFPLSLPFDLKLSDVKSSNDCRWIHPDRVEILGTWHAGYQTKKEPVLDLIVTIPQAYFGSRDFLNFAYFVKRAHYIGQIAKILSEAKMSVKFVLEHFDTLKPLLLVSDGMEANECVRIHFVPPRNFTKLSRFRPENNNLRPSFCSPHFGSLSSDTPTPIYNTKIAVDVLREEIESEFAAFFTDKPNFSKAYIVIRTWMLHRGFMQRRDGFSDLLLSAWLIFIHDHGNFAMQSSVFDIVVAFLSSLISTNWKESPLGLCDTISDTLYAQFLSHFDVVFLDYTGYLNLAAFLSIVALEQIRTAAADALVKINLFNEFDILFEKNHPFTLAFDHYLRIRLPQLFRENIFQKMFNEECVSTCNDQLSIFIRRITPILKEAFAERVENFDFYVPNQESSQQWDIHEEPRKPMDEFHVLVGFRFTSKWNNSLTRGPPAKSPEAIHFRQFWGDICELRKFPDNAICEAVVWNSSGTDSIPLLICRHILQRNLKLEPFNVEERTMKVNEMLLPNVSERYTTIGRAYEKLSQTLRMIQDLPLLITGIHPVSAYLRRTVPFAPPSTYAVIERHSAVVKDAVAFPILRTSPTYLPTVEVQITMEQSGKWGDELGAIARLKTAFYIELAKVLKAKYSMQAVPFDDYLIVHFNSVVFRLMIAYPKEVNIMRKLNAGKTGIPKDSAAVRAKELEVMLKPQLTALLHSAAQQFEAFAETCRLAAYWLSSHMLSDYVNEIILETIVASVFLKPISLLPPRTSFVAFGHFLTLLHTHNWLMKPLVVDFNKQWTEEDIDEIQKEFIKMRPVLPAMVVCTSVDRSGYRWTREEPQPLILKRIIALARASTALIEQHISGPTPLNLEGVFTTEGCTPYDAVIRIRGRHMVRRRTMTTGTVVEGPLPVVDYDPVRQYVKRLRECFASVALFFYNKYFGNVIGVVWKRNALGARDATISSCLHRAKGSDNKLTINTGAVLEDFTLLGHGMVREVTQNCVIGDDDGTVRN